MGQLGQFHASRGTLSWNSDSTLCPFKPDSMMVPKTQHMVHLDRNLTQMMENRLGSMITMAAHGAGSMGGEMMFHSSTMDIPEQGNGHNGHH